MMEFSPTGLKQLTAALKEASRQPDEAKPDYLAQAKRWGWIQKILGWAGLLSTIFWLWKNWGSIKDFFKNLWPQLKEGWGWLKKQLSIAWGWFWDWFSTTFPETAQWFEGKWTSFTTWWQDSVWGPIVAWWDGLWADVQVGVDGQKKDKRSWWDKLWDGIKSTAYDAVEFVADWLSKFMLLVVAKGFQNLWAVLTTKTKDQQGNATSFLDRAGAWINTFWNASKDLISSWFNNVFMMEIKKQWILVVAAGKGFLSGAEDVLGKVISYVGQWIRVKVIKLMTPPLQSTYMWIMDKVDQLKVWWGATLRKLKIAVSSVIIGILETIPSILRSTGMDNTIKAAKATQVQARTEFAATMSEINKTRRLRKNVFPDFNKAEEKKLKDLEKDIKAGETIRGRIKTDVDIATKSMEGNKEFKDAAAKHKDAKAQFNKRINDATDLLKGSGDSMKKTAMAIQNTTDVLKVASDQLANQEVVSTTKEGQTLLDTIMTRIDKTGTQTGILKRIETAIANIPNQGVAGMGPVMFPGQGPSGLGGSSLIRGARGAARAAG
jgi:hypothetical protein